MAKICQSCLLRAPSKARTRFPRGEPVPARAKSVRLPFRWGTPALPLFLFYCLMPRCSHAQNRDVLCRDGDGEFAAEFPTGVKVQVGPARKDGLATRTCEATLSWGDQSQVVATGASQLDIDALGADLGLGVPVVALQVRKSKDECCMEYDIYSLRAPPALLRHITGGEFFSAADTDLDGRVEIWTDDAAAVDGVENFHARDLDFAPPVVLRFARGRLLDASSEFRPYFDQKIADEQAKLDPHDLAEFKSSDGKLAAAGSAIPASRLIQLRSVKTKVLEIAWSYLYSGREQEAWRSLEQMWPAADFERIRTAVMNARARGIHSQVDGASTPVRPGRETHAKIFDGTTSVAATPGVTPKDLDLKQITPPRAILMERPAPSTPLEIALSQAESELVLVIDSAGKVRSVEETGKFQSVDEGLLKSTTNWKFIPAFNGGQPVASKILLGVSLRK
jgi:hypothetical protein